MTANVDKVRYQMLKVANQKDVVKQSKQAPVVDIAPGEILMDAPQFFTSFETRVLSSFHTGSPAIHQINIAKYVIADIVTCHSIAILRMAEEGKTFRVYFRGNIPLESVESFDTADFECVQEILSAKSPTLQNDDTTKAAILAQWKPIFGHYTDTIVGIPIIVNDGYDTVIAIVAISFKKIPKGFFEKKLSYVQETLEMLVPYACNNQGVFDNREDIYGINRVLESIETVEKVVGTNSTDTALTQIGTEVGNLSGCKNLVIFTIDHGDSILRKYYANCTTTGRSYCPSKKIHSQMEIPLGERSIAALSSVATSYKGMRINQASELNEYGISSRFIHSIGNCNCNSMIIAPVVDYSSEYSLLIELSEREDKGKGFNMKEFEMALLFCQHAACLLTCTVLLDRRDRNHRRRNIINEMLCNIVSVKHTNVEQFISHHRKTSRVYRGNFDEFNLCIRCHPEQDIAGIALELFYELDIVRDFKIRRSVLVRFILSVQQGYGTLPYHNWNHAVSVAHFAYLLIKKLRLVELGHLSKLDCFALVVSALTHDIDHRGTNNQFQSYTNSDIYKLYACEDSVMERHHLAIALAILHREDCNILESFNDSDYKYFVELLTWNIIATDISKHLKNRETLFLDSKSSSPKQRKMARLSLFMTAADLCDNCKKWDDNLPTVKAILQEFFTQGDMERQLGFTPIPMMDRQVAYVPMIEYKFVKYIVTPVYRFLSELYVELTPCLQTILMNEDLWTLSTVVFDQNKQMSDQLDILDLPAMKEDALRQLKLNDSLENVKKRKFSLTIPPPGTTTTERKLTLVAPVQEEEMEEVDTGEKRKCRCTFCICCCEK